MFELTMKFSTIEELQNAVSLLGGTSAKAVTVLSASDQARLRGDALVVPPSTVKAADPSVKAAADKAEKAAAAKAAKAAKAAEIAAAAAAIDEPAEAPAEVSEAEAEAADAPAGDSSLTHDDVKKLLIEVRGAFPGKASIISEIVRDHGKAAKISDVAESLLPNIAAHCRKLLTDRDPPF